MLIAHRIALDPTNAQRTYFARASGTARFAWNWALAEWQRQFTARKDDPSLPAPSDASLRRRLNGLKREEFPWMFDVTKCAAQEAIIDLGSAFRNFFEKRGRYPRFKKKGVSDSFCAANEAGTFRTDGEKIKLPVVGWVRLHEALRFTGKLKRVTVSREADRWYASIMVETNDIKPVVQPLPAVGVDLGVTTLATLSRGEAIPGPKAHKALLQRLRRASRALTRKRKGSSNRRKAKAKLARLHARISAIRKDATHKATTMLAKTYRRIGIEALNVRGMARNRHLARSIMDGGFFEFRRQLEYKAKFYGAAVVVADRWFPSSKTCSCCGSVKAELALSQRLFHCDECGYEAGRDHNAARNLENMAASFAVSACGEDRSDAVRKPRVKRASMKQEPDSKLAA
ncbi:RNA-guided endonuclease InsQ/TnpB family protein [Acidiphilium cryptum]|uniref:Transposase, IS605 OrfB family n=1 Tax=Acidiphilium cryptum (strain JF-5) TaxID=349163 RepID=A5FTK5_ACICJ|nr:RNA-guided endonuclease TnpB family protein [Acidiphilium cryptum]ABQ28937.1 transposase, IS605 OrfB family [Acidiphilium cryptum JF-5]